MTPCFESVRDVVLGVGAAWDKLYPALDSLHAEAVLLGRLADDLGEGRPAELVGAGAAVEELRGQVEADPLEAEARCAEMSARLRAARARLEESARGRDELRSGLAAGRDLLARLAEVLPQAREAVSERQAKIAASPAEEPPAAPDDAQVAALHQWLDRLEGTRARGLWQPARVGLARWVQAAAAALAAAEAARDGSRQLLDRRCDLRGLLGALRAKAEALGRADEPDLAALAQEARELLRRRPTPLMRAAELVAEYQRRLAGS
jgi:hypothetical protein